MASKQVDQAKVAKGRRGHGPLSSVSELMCKWPLPEYRPVAVRLQARVCTLRDAAFKRRYLVEERDIEAQEAKFKLGDLLWVKTKNRPYWPAMVSIHPQRDMYLKWRSAHEIAYHVQFFGITFRGWISGSLCKRFRGFAKFEHSMLKKISKCAPIKLGKVWRSFAIQPDQKYSLNQLNEAIAEAEEAEKWSPQQRVQRLTYRYFSKRYNRFYD